MTQKEQFALVQSILVQELAQRVVEKLLDVQKEALVVFTGSNIGIDAALDGLRELRQDGFTYHVLLTRSAAAILDVNAIRNALEPEELWVEQPGQTPEALTARYHTVLVPALTVHTAAHVASCMADTPAAAIILDGLMRGKNVVVSTDGCCPDHPERTARGFHMTQALKQKLRGNLEAIRDYGAHLSSSNRLRTDTLRAIRSFFPDKPVSRPAQEIKKENQPQEVGAMGRQVIRLTLGGRVLSVSSLKTCPHHSLVIAPKGTIVTALAADEARRMGIIIKIDQ